MHPSTIVGLVGLLGTAVGGTSTAPAGTTTSSTIATPTVVADVDETEPSSPLASGDFCPIVWDASLSDCGKLKRLGEWLDGMDQTSSSVPCIGAKELVYRAVRCCQRKNAGEYQCVDALRRVLRKSRQRRKAESLAGPL